MLIDLITLHAIKNYGSALQAFATQKILEEMGFEVRIINYIRDDARDENLYKNWCGSNILKKIVMFPTINKWKKVFGKFNKNYLNLTNKIYTTDNDFLNYDVSEADAFCTGSDQVWNSIWNKGIIKPLYLNFVPDKKYRFAFSASFGQSELSIVEINETRKYIDKYNKISVREETGKKILDEQYGYKGAVHLIDPTLNLCGDGWRKVAKTKKCDGNYILIYNLNRSSEFDEYAKKLSKKTGLKLIRFCTRFDQVLRPGKSIIIPEIFDFVRLIDNAKYVLTDSFHATAFSMNLNTEPICVYPKEFGGRIEGFLKLVNSEQRHIKDYEDFDVLNRPVDFNRVNQILDIERKKTNDFLIEIKNDLNERELNHDNSMRNK